MSDGDLQADHQRVQRAVTDAETVSGLEITVVFCLDDDGMREQAERTFDRLGLANRPAVLVLVEPLAGAFDVEIAPRARHRVKETACRSAVEIMTACFDQTDNLAECIERGLRAICDVAGKPDVVTVGPAVPDVLLVTPEA
ncbi:MAG: hypothetical protein ACRDJP_07530 [Actinomycetota bacterium]